MGGGRGGGGGGGFSDLSGFQFQDLFYAFCNSRFLSIDDQGPFVMVDDLIRLIMECQLNESLISGSNLCV